MRADPRAYTHVELSRAGRPPFNRVSSPRRHAAAAFGALGLAVRGALLPPVALAR